MLRFRFLMRGSVEDGAVVCATGFVGLKPSPSFQAVGRHHLFCLQKGVNGFELLSPTESQITLHQIELRETVQPEVVIEKPK